MPCLNQDAYLVHVLFFQPNYVVIFIFCFKKDRILKIESLPKLKKLQSVY